jgi:hypothetical protein
MLFPIQNVVYFQFHDLIILTKLHGGHEDADVHIILSGCFYQQATEQFFPKPPFP